jgi:hypothetical protein
MAYRIVAYRRESLIDVPVNRESAREIMEMMRASMPDYEIHLERSALYGQWRSVRDGAESKL